MSEFPDTEFHPEIQEEDLDPLPDAESVEFAWERQFNVEREWVQCPTCDGEGDVLHDIDCDGCAQGEDHSETCPRCGGETVVPALIPKLGGVS